MKVRTPQFLAQEKIDHASEVFDYVRELHEILWRVVRSQIPGASGSLDQYVDAALASLEH